MIFFIIATVYFKMLIFRFMIDNCQWCFWPPPDPTQSSQSFTHTKPYIQMPNYAFKERSRRVANLKPTYM